jgi:hypothetical protein
MALDVGVKKPYISTNEINRNRDMLNIIASYDNGSKIDKLEMSKDALEEWVWYYYAYEEYDSILVDGVEVAEMFGLDIRR